MQVETHSIGPFVPATFYSAKWPPNSFKHETQACNICISLYSIVFPARTLKGALAWIRLAVVFLHDISTSAPQGYESVDRAPTPSVEQLNNYKGMTDICKIRLKLFSIIYIIFLYTHHTKPSHTECSFQHIVFIFCLLF